MKPLTTIIIFAFCMASCKKEAATVKLNAEFSFGTAYNFCSGNCASFYAIADGQLYPDDMDRFTNAGSLKFKVTPLGNDKYLLAKQLLNEFPVYLLKHPDTTLGCPDCSDGGLAYIELKQDGKKMFWYLDLQRKPVEIADYLQKLQDIIEQL